MKNLLNFFFSFDKLFKEKLIVPAFWLAIVYYGLEFLRTAVDGVQLDPLLWIINPIAFFAKIVFTLLAIRIVAELAVAIFRINNNLSPDKGKSETADIDPVAEARKAAELAASRTRELTHSATEKTKSTFEDVKHSVEDTTESLTARAKDTTGNLTARAKDATQSAKARTESVMGKGSVPEPGDEPTPVKILEPSAADASTVKRGRGRPKGSKNKPKSETAATAATGEAPVKRGPGRPKGSSNKTTTAKSTTASADAPVKRGRGRPKGSKNKPKTATSATATTGEAPVKRGRGRPKGSKNKPKPAGTATASKPGPKPGRKIPRDADGNLLKKDGTPRKKPGPKPKA